MKTDTVGLGKSNQDYEKEYVWFRAITGIEAVLHDNGEVVLCYTLGSNDSPVGGHDTNKEWIPVGDSEYVFLYKKDLEDEIEYYSYDKAGEKIRKVVIKRGVVPSNSPLSDSKIYRVISMTVY